MNTHAIETVAHIIPGAREVSIALGRVKLNISMDIHEMTRQAPKYPIFPETISGITIN